MPHEIIQQLSTQESQISIENPMERRQAFINSLEEQGLISSGLAHSEHLDKFIIDDTTGSDALMHILVGDSNGGAHHLRTIHELGVPDRAVYSEVNYEDGPKVMQKLRREQSIRPSGAFRSRKVNIDGKDKIGGSAMFPSEWTAEDVILGVLSVASQSPEKHDLERGSYIHNGEVRGVRIHVVTSEKTGKIITAAPKIASK